MEEKTINRINWYIVAVSFLVLIIALMGYWLYSLNNSISIKEAEHDKSEIVREIDSLKARRDDTGKQLVKHSQTQAKKSDSLLKTIKNEKTVIRDTTYAAMCEYITNYRQP